MCVCVCGVGVGVGGGGCQNFALMIRGGRKIFEWL